MNRKCLLNIVDVDIKYSATTKPLGGGGGGMGIWVTIKHVFLIKPSKECCGYAERRLCRFKMEIKGAAYAELIKELKESENNTSLDLRKKAKRHWLHMSSPV
ncbi:hypothetical protein Tco_0966240 [Tanacetum coccineum]